MRGDRILAIAPDQRPIASLTSSVVIGRRSMATGTALRPEKSFATRRFGADRTGNPGASKVAAAAVVRNLRRSNR